MSSVAPCVPCYERSSTAPHITALPYQQRVAKQQALEDDRLVRLEQLRSHNVQEVETLRTEAAAVLTKTESAWTVEKNELERGLLDQVHQSMDATHKTLWFVVEQQN